MTRSDSEPAESVPLCASPDATCKPDFEADLQRLFQSDERSLDLLLDLLGSDATRIDEAWAASYLRAIGVHVRKTLSSPRYSEPLERIAAQLRTAAIANADPLAALKGSDRIFCEAAAEISYLAITGLDEETAAQKVARTLMAAGHELPAFSGDARGWMRLYAWRQNLRKWKKPEHLFTAYQAALAQRKARHT